MSYAIALREKQARLSTEMRAIVAAAREENNRGLTSEEQEKFAKMETEYTGLEASIKTAEKVDTIGNDLRGVDRDKIVAFTGDVDPKAAKAKYNDAHGKAFSNYLRTGMEGLNQEEKQVMVSKFVTNFNNAAQTSTTTGGGYLIPQGFSDQLEDALKFYGGILGVVDSFDTETGAPLPWPTDNDVVAGRIIGQNVQVTNTAITFGQVIFNSYIGSSDLVLVPLSLLQDGFFNLDTFIARKLGERIGRLWNTKFTVGSGTNEPTGIQTAVVAAGNTITGATGQTTSVIYDDLVNLLHAVDPAYRMMPSAKYMFHDSTLKVLRKLKDSAGRPLWQPGISAGFGNQSPETILDKPYVINNDMPVMGVSAASILFGDMSKYKVRKVAGGTTVLRLVERYADYLQVGYIGFMRADGQLLDAGTHPIAAYVNSAT